MLPLQQAFEVRSAIEEYLKATFSFKDKAVHDAFYRFIEDPEDGIFKGPYVSLKLPFVSAPAGVAIPLEIKPSFPPYRHQYESFCRLATGGDRQPQPTLITTGTSSGKTESFLFPLLDYCHRHADRPGIKAIILYPMNALATDQAKRLAELIWKDDRLKGKITAGLFIGEGTTGKKRSFHRDMGPNHIIEDRSDIVQSPPDILLTNFKMLDYGLMHGRFDNLWHYNYADPSLLRFLVLDELHTYDGAQGTDVANLVRRLKLKLKLPDGQLCPVGTSATMGNTPDAVDSLVKYAARIFGEPIGADAVLSENRLELAHFMPPPQGGYISSWPHPNAIQRSRIGANESYDHYLAKQKTLWQLDPQCTPIELGQELKNLQIVHDLLHITGAGIIHYNGLKTKLAEHNAFFAQLSDWDGVHQYSPRDQVLQSLLALLAAARTQSGSKEGPLLYLQVQLWVRELTGVLRKTTQAPAFTWKSSADANDQAMALPAYHCRECGSCGWLGVRHDNELDRLQTDIAAVYAHYFDYHKNLFFLNVKKEEYQPLEEYRPTDTLGRHCHLESDSLYLADRAGEGRFEVVGYRVLRSDNNNRSRHICPDCNTEESLSIIGTRVATLSSITVSQVLSSDLDPRIDQERKILAFTNSVQDAAHQAGFTEARNYRFTFRASLQQVLNQASGPVSLPQLEQLFVQYWKTQADPTGGKDPDAYVYRFFPADYKGKVSLKTDYRDQQTGTFNALLSKELDTRMGWEIVSEYGYNAQVGRTLEKTGASAVHFDLEKIKAVFEQASLWMQANGLEMIDAENCHRFVHGLLQRLRIRGGIHHPYLEKYRNNGLKQWDLNWSKDPRHFLNRMYGSKTRKPKVLVTTPRPPEGADTTYTLSINWYHAYFRKAFLMAPANNTALINEFYEVLVGAMKDAGLLHEAAAATNPNYAIEPAAVLADTAVSIYQCSHCNSRLQTTEANILAVGTHCLDYSCPGSYTQSIANELNYYRQVYNRSRSPRIYAAEHTGMLPRDLREDVEVDFKQRPAYNSLNALVATSTLEMGIDIGTLNAVLNNSVPPATANFLQRVGRAGRSSGSALVTNFAEGRNHDLYHFTEPLGMMDGEVGTPGCFLEAKEILRRHFFAFCIDSWATDNPTLNQLPGIIGKLKLASLNLTDPAFRMNQLLAYIKKDEAGLLQAFRDIYANDQLPEALWTELAEKLHTGKLYNDVRKVMQGLKDELIDLTQRSADINQTIRSKKLAPSDPEYQDLKAEQKGILGIRRRIEKRQLVEHLTNRGLLPNYAFPETGVKLQGTIRGYTAKGSNAAPLHEEFEIVRDAATALRELAPGSDFYGLGYKFHISGLNTYDWKDPEVLVTKRYCSNCDHLDDDRSPVAPCCPKCNDLSWAAQSNTHTFVRLAAVKSANKREDATLDDSKDERSEVFYRRTRHLQFDEKTSCGGMGLREVPFGIEYVKHVTCTEINLGESKAVHSNRIVINSMDDVPRHGFITCVHCGKSSIRTLSSQEITDGKYHYLYCKHRDKVYTGNPDDAHFKEVFLYRQMETEALKVLLPVQEFDTAETIELFKAGITAGLRLYYKGNPGHIALWDYREFNKQTGRFDRYLVLFDTIPGGTGYLEKLFNKEEFIRLLTLAHRHLHDCACQHQGKRGCYRCIFTYQNQYAQDSLDRARAADLFGRIISQLDQWEDLPEGLGTVAGTGRIEESELEERFVRLLRFQAKQKEGEGWKWVEQRDGHIFYQLTLTSNNAAYTWQINPQVVLGAAQGINTETRADFVATLVRATIDGAEVDRTWYDTAPRWAVYLDGYAFHAQPPHLRFFEDVQRRQQIAESQQFRSWTLTWTDLDNFEANLKAKTPADQKTDALCAQQPRYRDSWKALAGLVKKYNSSLPHAADNVARWLCLVTLPFSSDAATHKMATHLALLQAKPGIPSFDAGMWPQVLFAPISNTLRASNMQDCCFVSEASCSSSFARLNIAVHLQEAMRMAALELFAVGDSLEQQAWVKFWQAYNLVQDSMVQPPAPQPVTSKVQNDTTAPFLQFYDEDLHGIVRQLVRAGIAVSPEGSFFLSESGFEPAEAAIGCPDKKLFIRPVSEEDQALFCKAGYTEILPEAFDIDLWK